MSDTEFFKAFNQLRKRFAKAVWREIRKGDGCKSYEGTWELLIGYPDAFEDETGEAEPNFYRIQLHCYVLGPNRHYEWSGDTWEQALERCLTDVEGWLAPYAP